MARRLGGEVHVIANKSCWLFYSVLGAAGCLWGQVMIILGAVVLNYYRLANMLTRAKIS